MAAPLRNLQPDFDALLWYPFPAVPVHWRTVTQAAGHYWFECSCGYVSLGFVERAKAACWPCPVEVLWQDSRERAQRLRAAVAADDNQQ